MAGQALAMPPVREYLPAGDMDLPDTCAFPLHIHLLVNDEYLTTYFDADGEPVRQHIQGNLIVEVTRTDTGDSVAINASGPAWIDLVAGEFIAQGHFLQWGPEIDGLNLYRGRFDFNGHGTGSVVSVCEMLAG
jgi:hypothetical protein